MAVHGGAELQFAAQLGVIDDMCAVGLHHILQDANSLGIIVVFDGLGCLLLVAEKSGRQCFRMFTGNIIQVVGLHMAGCHGQTVVDGAESKLVARHVGLVEGARGLCLEEQQIDFHGRVFRELLADGGGIRTTVDMMVG